MKTQSEVSDAEMRQNILQRLKKIEGQVKGLQRMIENEMGCSDILVQVAAVRAAVNRVGILLIERHSRRCLEGISHQGNQDAAINDLLGVLSKFIK